jgi:hypothetical protein
LFFWCISDYTKAILSSKILEHFRVNGSNEILEGVLDYCSFKMECQELRSKKSKISSKSSQLEEKKIKQLYQNLIKKITEMVQAWQLTPVI